MRYRSSVSIHPGLYAALSSPPQHTLESQTFSKTCFLKTSSKIRSSLLVPTFLFPPLILPHPFPPLLVPTPLANPQSPLLKLFRQISLLRAFSTTAVTARRGRRGRRGNIRAKWQRPSVGGKTERGDGMYGELDGRDGPAIQERERETQYLGGL